MQLELTPVCIHDIKAVWKILDGVNFQCKWERTEDSFGKLKSELEKGQLKWKSSFDADFLGHIIDQVVEELKLKPKSRLKKRVVLEETVEEKKPTSFRDQTSSETLATSSHSINTSETPTIPQKDIMDFLEDIVAEADAERGVILIEDENEASPNLDKPWFSSDSISRSKWSMTIHNTEAAWKILDGVKFQCEWERTEDSFGKLKSELEKGQLKWELSFDVDFLGHIIDQVVEELKLKLKSRLRKRVVLEETVEEKEPTSFGTKSLPITKKPMKKKKKKDRKEEKGKKEIEGEKDEKEKTKENDCVPASVPRKENVIYPFLKIPTSNGFAVFGNLHQIEWGETVLMMDSAWLPESSNVSSSSSSPPS